jgi:energy-coupling factor transporter transmembrane protein EcfT
MNTSARTALIEKSLAVVVCYILLAGGVGLAALLWTAHVMQSPGFHVAAQLHTPTVGDLASYMPPEPKLNTWGIFSIGFAWLLAVAVTLRAIHGIIRNAVKTFTKERTAPVIQVTR